ncbi:unnamed protein product [Protopolystoma xenopodis]|uniref:Polycomb protein VEFS-Box domain-containing protein n=1 Tax=Protopolystoma xenopodis TaxID=117903 RepID=A0A448WZZ1_9PLAT|nr:unnamed protein product [Protopolystoma xenopodis]
MRPCHLVVCDSQLPGLVIHFLRSHAGWLAERGLRANLLLHLANLTDCGLLSPGQLRQAVGLYDHFTNAAGCNSLA